MVRSAPAGSLTRIATFTALWRAWRQCRRGKSRSPAVAGFDLDADTAISALSRELSGGRYVPSPWRIRVIRDPKVRVIAAPQVRDRVVHRALLNDIGRTYERSFVATSYAVGQQRGPHRAALRYLEWTRRYRYRVSLDVRQYFPSIHHPTLLALLARRLRDVDTLALIERLLAAGGAVYQTPEAEAALHLDAWPHPADRGLALGSYLSQWCGGFYLDGLDHFVLRDLKMRAYLRYMDDFTLFGDDRSRLLNARAAIVSWLDQERRLTLNPKRWHSGVDDGAFGLPRLPVQPRRGHAVAEAATPVRAEGARGRHAWRRRVAADAAVVSGIADVLSACPPVDTMS